jgi:hypothetical protein
MRNKIVSVLVSIFLSVTPLFSQSENKEFTPPAGYSQGMVDESMSAFSSLHDHLNSGTAAPKHFIKATEAFKMAVLNWDESGLTDKLQVYLLENEQKILDGPTSEELHLGYLRVSSHMMVTEAEYDNSMLRFTRTDRVQFMSDLKSFGLKTMNHRAVLQLENYTDRVSRGNQSALFQTAGWIGVVGLYLGIVAMAVSGPVGVAIGIAALAISAYDILTDPDPLRGPQG